MTSLNATHDPSLRSFVESANSPDADFPIQNLPFGIFSRRDAAHEPRPGVAIGDMILDLSAAHAAGLFRGDAAAAADSIAGASALNPLMSQAPEVVSAFRAAISSLLRHDSSLATDAKLRRDLLVPMTDALMHLPASIGDYTDFYASIHHATNVGKLFRPDNPLLPNYKWVPIGYHGRSSSIVISGTPVHRPSGQLKPPDAAEPTFGPCKLLDYELEVGVFVGPGNQIGHPIPIDQAERHLFGLCLVNDWSARDIQTWEYQPLGPFLAKNFATTISPWVVTMEALAPFRAPAFKRAEGDPTPLPYLFDPNDQQAGGIDLTLEVYLSSQEMRSKDIQPMRLSRGSFTDMYWTVAQLLAHHASNGCPMRPGDLLASGTVSGASKDSRGSLLELTTRGTEPITLPTGEPRKFLQEGDEVTTRGFAERPKARRIGFGECKGVITAGA